MEDMTLWDSRCMSSQRPLASDPIAEAYRQWTRRGWGDVADAMAAITSIMRVQQAMLSRVEAVLKTHNLTMARYELLALLAFSESGSLPMAKISSRLQVHPASITNVVDRLESAALVARCAHPSDRRATIVKVTPEGIELTQKATLDLNSKLFAEIGLDHTDLTQLNKILARYRFHIGDFAEDAPPPPWDDD